MKRRSFLGKLLAGAVAAPVMAKLVAETKASQPIGGTFTLTTPSGESDPISASCCNGKPLNVRINGVDYIYETVSIDARFIE